jgi:hypothetical protein
MCYNGIEIEHGSSVPATVMRVRQAVLLTPSKYSDPALLLSCQQYAPVSPLFVALTSSLHSSHSIAFSRLLFSYSYELFCTPENHNAFVFLQIQTPLQKHRGWGTLSPLRDYSLPTTTHYPLSVVLCIKSPKSPLCFQQFAHSSAFTGEGEGTHHAARNSPLVTRERALLDRRNLPRGRNSCKVGCKW